MPHDFMQFAMYNAKDKSSALDRHPQLKKKLNINISYQILLYTISYLYIYVWAQEGSDQHVTSTCY